MMNVQIRDSARQAVAILEAWQDGDEQRLALEANAIARLAKSTSDTNEMERVEVLEGIAYRLQVEHPRPGDPSMQVYRDLLQHLALD